MVAAPQLGISAEISLQGPAAPFSKKKEKEKRRKAEQFKTWGLVNTNKRNRVEKKPFFPIQKHFFVWREDWKKNNSRRKRRPRRKILLKRAEIGTVCGEHKKLVLPFLLRETTCRYTFFLFRFTFLSLLVLATHTGTHRQKGGCSLPALRKATEEGEKRRHHTKNRRTDGGKEGKKKRRKERCQGGLDAYHTWKRKKKEEGKRL